jgi:hypothetical protein
MVHTLHRGQRMVHSGFVKYPEVIHGGGMGLCLENDMREIESYTEGLKNTQGH